MSGNCATGMRSSASSAGDRDDERDDDREPWPIDKDRRDHCFAFGSSAGRGRGAAAPSVVPVSRRGNRRRRGSRAGRHDLAGADTLQPLADDQLSFLEPIAHHGRGRRRLAELDAPLLRLVLRIDDIDVIALLIGQHRGARNGENRDRLHALLQHGHELAVEQFARSRCIRLACPEAAGSGKRRAP